MTRTIVLNPQRRVLDALVAWVSAHPLPTTCLAAVVWLIPGLIGRDPWKPDEAYSFGLVYHIVQSGDWVIPTLAGEPFMEKPPVFYVTAALFARLLSGVLPLH